MTPPNSRTDRLRICQMVASAGGVGGLEKHVLELTRELAGRHDVSVVADPAYREMFSKIATFFPCDFSRSRLDPRVLWEVGTILRGIKADLIHAHANKAAGIISMLRPLLSGKKVATIHGLKRRTAMFRGFDKVIAVSRAVAERLSPGTPCQVIYNGLHRDAIKPTQSRAEVRASLNIPKDRQVIVTAGRLVPVKGFDVLLQAMPDIEADLLIAGDGPDHDQLTKLIETRGLSNRVRLLGFRSDVPNLLQAADVAVISSRREGFPYFLLEALHSERILVSTRVPGAVELLSERYLCDVEDPQALGRTLQNALSHFEQSQHDFRPLWQRAAQELTFDAMVKQIEGVYRELTLGIGAK